MVEVEVREEAGPLREALYRGQRGPQVGWGHVQAGEQQRGVAVRQHAEEQQLRVVAAGVFELAQPLRLQAVLDVRGHAAVPLS